MTYERTPDHVACRRAEADAWRKLRHDYGAARARKCWLALRRAKRMHIDMLFYQSDPTPLRWGLHRLMRDAD